LSKLDIVLEELQNNNYYLDAIAHKTGMTEARVSQLIGRLVVQGKIEGEVNQEQTMFVPGYTSEEYKKNVKIGTIARILALLSMFFSMTLPIVFVIVIAVGSSFQIDQWKINMSYILAAVTLLVCISSIVVSIRIRSTKIGKGTFALSVIALIFATMVTLMIVLFLTLFKEFLANAFP